MSVNANDFVVGLDPTGYTQITAEQLAQLVNSAYPQVDKGMVIVTTDASLNTPDVPKADETIKWQRYLWVRIQPATTSFSIYAWNPSSYVDSTYKYWNSFSIGTIPAGTIQNYQLAGGITADKLYGGIATSQLAAGATFLTQSIAPTAGDIEGTYAAGLTIGAGKVTNVALKADTTSGAPNAAVKTSNIVDGNVTLAKLDRTGTAAKILTANGVDLAPTWNTPKYVYSGLANPDATGLDDNKIIAVESGALAGAAGTYRYQLNGIVGDSRNYVSSTSGSVKTVTYAGDMINLQGVNSCCRTFGAFGGTIDGTVIGAVNGLDAGALTTTNWYYIWIISNGTTVGGLLSLSSTTPTMPTGYTYKALMGATYYLGTTLNAFLQQDRTIYITDTNLCTAKAFTNSYVKITDYDDVTAIETVIPPIAKKAFGTAGATTGQDADIAISYDTSGIGATTIAANRSSALIINTFAAAGPFTVPLVATNYFYVKSDTNTAKNRVNISGYII